MEVSESDIFNYSRSSYAASCFIQITTTTLSEVTITEQPINQNISQNKQKRIN